MVDLQLRLQLTSDHRLEGSVLTGDGEASFSGTLELLRLLESAAEGTPGNQHGAGR